MSTLPQSPTGGRICLCGQILRHWIIPYSGNKTKKIDYTLFKKMYQHFKSHYDFYSVFVSWVSILLVNYWLTRLTKSLFQAQKFLRGLTDHFMYAAVGNEWSSKNVIIINIIIISNIPIIQFFKNWAKLSREVKSSHCKVFHNGTKLWNLELWNYGFLKPLDFFIIYTIIINIQEHKYRLNILEYSIVCCRLL